MAGLSVFSPFKLANVPENAGTVKEDRIAGIRANLGEGPATIPVQTLVTDLDRGKTRDGQSDVRLGRHLVGDRDGHDRRLRRSVPGDSAR
jgi:hypothetical protein